LFISLPSKAYIQHPDIIKLIGLPLNASIATAPAEFIYDKSYSSIGICIGYRVIAKTMAIYLAIDITLIARLVYKCIERSY
jgi:hypothetical protein